MDDPSDTIDALRTRLGADSDALLARKLGIDKSTISSWRRRGNIPERYLRILSGEDHQAVLTPPNHWGPYEQYAFRLALWRYAKVRGKDALKTNLGEIYEVFAFDAGFWHLMWNSQKDLAAVLGERSAVLDTALALAIQDDIEAGDAAAARDTELMNSNNFSPSRSLPDVRKVVGKLSFQTPEAE